MPGEPQTFMGHSTNMSQKYREMPRANLEQIYKKVEPYLTVFSDDNSRQLKELERKTQETNENVASLYNENQRLKELVGQMAFQLGQVTAFIETIGYDPGFAPGEVMSTSEDFDEPIAPKSAKEIYEELVSKAPKQKRARAEGPRS